MYVDVRRTDYMILGAAGTHAALRLAALAVEKQLAWNPQAVRSREVGFVCYRCDYTALADRVLPHGGSRPN